MALEIGQSDIPVQRRLLAAARAALCACIVTFEHRIHGCSRGGLVNGASLQAGAPTLYTLSLQPPPRLAPSNNASPQAHPAWRGFHDSTPAQSRPASAWLVASVASSLDTTSRASPILPRHRLRPFGPAHPFLLCSSVLFPRQRAHLRHDRSW